MSRLQSLLRWVLSHCFISFRPIRKVAFTSIDYSSQGKLRVVAKTKLTFEGSHEETDDDFRIDHIALNGDDDDMSIESY